jgi:DNA-binding transcriptional MerR regulator
MKKYNGNVIKLSFEEGDQLDVLQYEPFRDGSSREVLPSRRWSMNLKASAPREMKQLWILHKTGFKGTPMDVILKGQNSDVQATLLMDWYGLKGIDRPCLKHKIYKKEEIAIVYECREKGVPYKQIYEKLQGRHSVRSIQELWEKERTRRGTKRNQRKFSQEELETIKSLREEGLTYRQIGERLNRCQGAVQAAYKGYTPRPERSLKAKLNEAAMKLYGHRFSTLLNWKDGADRQRKVREMVRGTFPLSKYFRHPRYRIDIRENRQQVFHTLYAIIPFVFSSFHRCP